jgi:hypothetical protein
VALQSLANTIRTFKSSYLCHLDVLLEDSHRARRILCCLIRADKALELQKKTTSASQATPKKYHITYRASTFDEHLI